MASAPIAAAAGADPASAGLPQFDFSWWPGEIVWTLVIFGVLFFLFSRVFVPKISGVIADREDRISGDFGTARKVKEEADALAAAATAEMEQARAVAQKLAVDAKSKAKTESAKREALEEAKLAEMLAKSDAMLTAARDAAMGHVRGIAEESAGLIISKLTGVAASADEIKSAATGA
jgi:F-type H+-transporting ATPase subunit b